MNKLEEMAILLFKHVTAKMVLDGTLSYDNVNEDVYRRLAVAYWKNYNENETDYLFSYLKSDFEDEKFRDTGMYSREILTLSVFDALFSFCGKTLVMQSDEVECEYSRLLHWREVSLEIHEDLLVCAYLAKMQGETRMTYRSFCWKPVISHNNYYLKKLVKEGIYENHFHLWGSASFFHLSWMSLMNFITDKSFERELKYFEKERRYTNIHYERSYEEESFSVMRLQAALIRLYLISWLHNIPIQIGNYYLTQCECEQYLNEDMNERRKERAVCLDELLLYSKFNETITAFLYDRLLKEKTEQRVAVLLSNPEKLMLYRQEIQNVIYELRYYNRNLGGDSRLDYAWIGLEELSDSSAQVSNGIFAGERAFLYLMLRKIYTEEKQSVRYYNWFYAYLLIKETIHTEMVQANQNVGFANFQHYQNRKGVFLNKSFFDSVQVKNAVKESILSENIQQLEARISPKFTAKKNAELIKKTDHLIDSNYEIRDRFFYVFHFTKEKDRERAEEYCSCRHNMLRKKLYQQGVAIRRFREEYKQEARRVLGIDACSQEIGCRPEVFGQVFRYLSAHKVEKEWENDIPVPQLQITYHVGEDFLDVVDGLRAIEEALIFLNMKCGDRLGHAIALGIDSKQWYSEKGYHIILSKQDYLDNVVWLYYKIVEFNIPDPDNVKEYLLMEYTRYFTDIYSSSFNENELEFLMEGVYKNYVNRSRREEIGKDPYSNDVRYNYNRVKGGIWDFSIAMYYQAWRLRGDNPDLYKKGYFMMQSYVEYSINSFAVNYTTPQAYEQRTIPEIAFLYYSYHYNKRVRLEGSESIDIKISEPMIQITGKVQKAMQKNLAQRGIGIETNPTSNVLISTFKKYRDHPIINLYNRGLISDKEFSNDCAQISVSINTDDKGVFATSLENEYALMACDLEHKRDKQGKFMYTRENIYEWLNNVRLNGKKQCFREIPEEMDSGIRENVRKLRMDGESDSYILNKIQKRYEISEKRAEKYI